ncbi:MAG TPA: RNA-binding protein [candidate division Zixibacteria bacterium]|nr:RNA-binding protein [candidate division Zixibacteria bacterium]
MSKKIYVGNIPFTGTETQIREMFEEYGTVDSVAWITDRDTGRFRGFAFVEMEDAAADSAINGLNGKDIDGRPLKVDEAKPRPQR